MPSTYTLISSNVLTSSAASVTFSAIPSTYTDLVLRASVRSISGTATYSNIILTYNGDTATNYSRVYLTGDGSTATSTLLSNQVRFLMNRASDGATATANSFSNWELYVPSYTLSQNKPFSVFSATETNATAADLNAGSGLWRNTSAITSITLADGATSGSTAFASGSSFYLYGIKNS